MKKPIMDVFKDLHRQYKKLFKLMMRKYKNFFIIKDKVGKSMKRTSTEYFKKPRKVVKLFDL
jgi:hypothetical protein